MSHSWPQQIFSEQTYFLSKVFQKDFLVSPILVLPSSFLRLKLFMALIPQTLSFLLHPMMSSSQKISWYRLQAWMISILVPHSSKLLTLNCVFLLWQFSFTEEHQYQPYVNPHMLQCHCSHEHLPLPSTSQILLWLRQCHVIALSFCLINYRWERGTFILIRVCYFQNSANKN